MHKVVLLILILTVSMILAADLQKSTVQVNGAKCEKCVTKVTTALKDVEGVEKVSVDIEKGQAVVEHNGVDEAKLVAAVEKAGYGKDGHNCDCQKEEQSSTKAERCCSKKSACTGKKTN